MSIQEASATIFLTLGGWEMIPFGIFTFYIAGSQSQAAALGISRGSVYYLPRPVPAADLALMLRIDKLHLDYPFAGSRMMRDFLVREGFNVGRLHVATLMKRMRIAAIYRRRTPRSRLRATRSTRICCASGRSRGPARTDLER